jgi:hypothetical protein
MLHEYYVVYSVRYYPRFHVTAVGLGTYYPSYGSTTALRFPLSVLLHPSSTHVFLIVRTIGRRLETPQKSRRPPPLGIVEKFYTKVKAISISISVQSEWMIGVIKHSLDVGHVMFHDASSFQLHFIV